MDSYSFANVAGFFKVARTTRETFVGTYLYRRNKEGQEVLLEECSVTGAEILKLAEERDKFKRLAEEECSKAARAQHDADEARNALQMQGEEAQEIIGELSKGLAVLAGESLRPCGPWVANGADPVHQKGRCPVHLGPKAAAAVDHSLAAWRALQEGNRAARETIQHQEETIRTYRHFQPEPDLLAALKEHQQGTERPVDTLRRIIQEREEARAEARALGDSALRIELNVARKNAEQFRRDLILALQDKDRLAQEKEAAESANRQRCLELAEKAGEIRELMEMLEYGARSRHGVNTLLALLDSEEPPARLEAAVAESVGSAYSSAHSYHRVIAQAAWRWLRGHVGSPPLSGDDLS